MWDLLPLGAVEGSWRRQLLPLRGALLLVLSTGQDSSTPQAAPPSACPSTVASLALLEKQRCRELRWVNLRTEGEMRMCLKYNGANNH